MDFNSIRALKTAKNEQRQESTFIKYLVAGNNYYAFRTYLDLAAKFDQNVALLSYDPLSLESIVPKGPSTIRGEDNQRLFAALYPDLDIENKKVNSKFFKEQKFRDFNSRSKPETLMPGEHFFTKDAIDIDLDTVLDLNVEAETFLKINEKRIVKRIKGIKDCHANDLFENAHYEIQFTDGSRLQCEHLVWANDPYSFYEMYQDKYNLKASLIEAFEKMKGPTPLYVKFIFDKRVTDNLDTLFVPISHTHEWGHFVGEFKNGLSDPNKQEVEFVTFLDSEKVSKEHISKIIRLLKRNLEKIFSNFSKINYEEFINFEDEYVCLNFDDISDIESDQGLVNMSFVSNRAPMKNHRELGESFEYSYGKISHLTRGILSQKVFEKKHSL